MAANVKNLNGRAPHNCQVSFVGEKEVAVTAGQSLLQASLNAGIPHFHICGGNAKCSTCRVMVLSGAGNLSAPNGKELSLSEKLHLPANTRLACQTYVNGPGVKLKRMIRDKNDIDLYINGAVPGPIDQIGEEKEAVLLFLDVRNFTCLMERCLPFDSVHIIRKLIFHFQKIINDHDGEIVETMGDGLYALYEGQNCRPSVQKAVSTAFLIFNELDNLNQNYFQPFFSQTLRLGIGVHKGKIITGQVIINGNLRKLAMGLSVNIAARLQDATKDLNNDFIISKDVYDALEHGIDRVPCATIHAKGVSQDLEVYLLGRSYR
jgi:adenylate cyclase